jgi:hypothetical protein
MTWLTAEAGNYEKDVGGEGNKGETKTRINSEIQQLIFAENPATTRNAHDVGVKIADIESKFRQMADCFAQTGQGLNDEGDFTVLSDWVSRTFPYY